MFIGKLNPLLTPVSYTIVKKNTKKAPAFLEQGNPFLGQTLSIDWRELISSGIDLYVTLPAGYLVNDLVLRFAEGSSPSCVSVLSAGKKSTLYRYSGETGKAITEKEIVLPVNEELTQFVIEISAEFSDIILREIQIFGASLDGVQLFPTPSSLIASEGFAAADALCSYSADCADAERAAAILKEKYAETSGCSLCSSDAGQIRLTYSSAVPENGYDLTVSKDSVLLCASDLRGFVMGVETLIKLIDNGSIPVCTVKDAPFMNFRGVHLFLPAPDQLDFAKRLIKYVLSPNGYNYIILEMGAGMRFDSHPEINAAFVEAAEKTKTGEWPALPHYEVAGGQIVEKDMVRDLVGYARSFGIEVIPEIQSLSHVQYQTLAHPDIAEISADGVKEEVTDARLADIPPSDFYAHSTCPCNPKNYEIVFDLIDEILDVVQPKKYVHMGHDEVYQIGICPICKDKDPAELFAGDVIKYRNYLAAKGLQMMIWSDMLQPIGENGKIMKSRNAVHLIPKDVILLDFIWYFHPEKDIEENLLPYGFTVIYGNMYSSHFTRFETRIRKDGIMGGQLSAWVGTNEADLAREGKIYDFIYTGQMLWSADYNGHNRYAYDRLIRKSMPTLRQQLQDIRYPSLLPGAKETVLADAGVFAPETAACGGTFSVDCKADSLIFSHTASHVYRRLPWKELEQIASYRITYTDGCTVSVPVTYAGNISHWNRRQNEPFANMYYRHNGYTATWYCDGAETRLPDGRIACIYSYEWINPHPERVIKEIALIPAENAETQVIVNKITVISL